MGLGRIRKPQEAFRDSGWRKQRRGPNDAGKGIGGGGRPPRGTQAAACSLRALESDRLCAFLQS